MLLVLLILTYAEKDEEFKKRLLGVLSFYRENRELLTALMQNHAAPAPAESAANGGETERTTKNSPPEGGENLHVLEDFLKRV